MSHYVRILAIPGPMCPVGAAAQKLKSKNREAWRNSVPESVRTGEWTGL